MRFFVIASALLLSSACFAQWSKGDTLRIVDSYKNNAWATIEALNTVSFSVDDLSDSTGYTAQQIKEYRARVAVAAKKLPQAVKSGKVFSLKNGQRVTFLEKLVITSVELKDFTIRPATAEDDKNKELQFVYRVKVKNGPHKDKVVITNYVKGIAPENGEPCTLLNLRRKGTPGTFEIDTLGEMYDAIDKGDEGTLRMYLIGERAFVLEPYVRVAIADRLDKYYQVRVLSGVAKGKLLYVYAGECEFIIADPNAK